VKYFDHAKRQHKTRKNDPWLTSASQWLAVSPT
jgi:hypothetical protein